MTGLHEGRGASLAVLLHGWGGDETSMAVFETAFGPGWRTVRLRAPYPLPGGGHARWIPQADGRPDPRMVQESWRALRGWMEELLHREARGASHRVVVGWTTVGNFIIDLRFFKVTITTPSRYIGSRKATRQSPFPFVPAKR
jgi:hypothetical protein